FASVVVYPQIQLVFQDSNGSGTTTEVSVPRLLRLPSVGGAVFESASRKSLSVFRVVESLPNVDQKSGLSHRPTCVSSQAQSARISIGLYATA
ncbi:MAG: hypothetical protein ABSH41_19625, partial [Syntrophobacteraceae bacterium]